MNEIKRLGKYEVLSVLGKGAMGIVHKAFDPHIRRPVAIKTIRKELIDDDQGESLVERFRREAQAAGRLSHPGIVGVYEYGEEANLAFIAMEFVEGLSLRDYFARGVRFSEPDVVSLMAQLLDALGYAHEQEVWHRDIKPANLIVTAAGRLKIADFGIARLPSSDLTQAGSVLGTPGYIAPEVYLGQDVDHRCDLFAAGAVMYQLLTGAGAFAGTAEAAMYKVCHEEPVPPSQKGEARCGAQYDALIAQALAKRPGQRFQNAKTFRAAVLSAYAQPVAAAISEETIITGVKASLPPSQGRRPDASSAVTRPSLAPATAPPSTVPSTALPPDWDPAVLAELEGLLTGELGPIARVVVRRAARQTDDLMQLIDLLANEVKDAAAQQTFTRTALKKVSSSGGRKTAMTRAATQATQAARQPTLAQTRAGIDATVALTPEHVERAVKLLAQHLGPIARAVAKRAAGQTTDRTQFDHQLAGSIEDPPQRARFLQALEKVQ